MDKHVIELLITLLLVEQFEEKSDAFLHELVECSKVHRINITNKIAKQLTNNLINN